MSNILGERRNKVVHAHRKFPCLLEHSITKDVAIWHNERQFTCIVVGKGSREFAGYIRPIRVIGALITIPDYVQNVGRNWVATDPNEQFVLSTLSKG